MHEVSLHHLSTMTESTTMPDPTKLTTKQLHREVSWEDKLRKQEIEHIKDLFHEATAARDRAIALLQAFADKSPTTSEVAGQVTSLKELVLSKFESADQQLTGVKSENKIALDAALQAQEKSANTSTTNLKESIKKSEDQFTKQIDQQREASQQTATNTDGKINDLKERVSAIENRSKGIGESWAVIVSIIGMMIAVVTLVMVYNSHK